MSLLQDEEGKFKKLPKSTDTSKVRHVHHDYSYTSGMYTFYILPKNAFFYAMEHFFSLATKPTFKRYTGVNTKAHITFCDLFVNKMHELLIFFFTAINCK